MFLKSVMVAAAVLSSASMVMVPIAMAAENAGVVTSAVATAQSLAATATPAERRPIIEGVLGTNPGAAIQIVEELKVICIEGSEVCEPAKAAAILQEILAFLGLKKENEAIIDQLLAMNADLLALGNSDVEPAAGGGGNNNPNDLGNTTGPGDTGINGEVVENPNQVSGNQVQ